MEPKAPLSVALNFAGWLTYTGLAFALLWTGKAPLLVMVPSVVWLLPHVDFVSVWELLKNQQEKKP